MLLNKPLRKTLFWSTNGKELFSSCFFTQVLKREIMNTKYHENLSLDSPLTVELGSRKLLKNFGCTKKYTFVHSFHTKKVPVTRKCWNLCASQTNVLVFTSMYFCFLCSISSKIVGIVLTIHYA